MQGSKVTNASKHFMAFGGGMRFCVGTDFTKLQMAAFLHCLVTKYRFDKTSHVIYTLLSQFSFIVLDNKADFDSGPLNLSGGRRLKEGIYFELPDYSFQMVTMSDSTKKETRDCF